MFSHTLFERELSDAEKAVFIVSLMNFSLGGKRVEADFTNFSGQVYKGLHSAKSSPSLGNYVGYLHSYLIGSSLLKTLWLNLLTREKIEENKYWTNGLGTPPWEQIPETENCSLANKLKTSYMGCLVAMSRFVFLINDAIYYLDGIQYPSHKEGWREPSMGINNEGKVLWLEPDKRPWRELTSLLSFIKTTTYDCQQINFGYTRARQNNQTIGIWSGGLKVRATAGDQSVKQDDDFIESVVMLPSNEELNDSTWFDELKLEMEELDQLAKIIYGSTKSFFTDLGIHDAKQAANSSNLFWQLTERQFQNLLNACEDSEKTNILRKTFAKFAHKAYDDQCPKDTARQLDAWAKNQPNLSKYLKNTYQPKEVQT